MNIFEQILDIRSLTAIGYKAEDALEQAPAELQEPLKAIIATNNLDEAWAIAHEQLGQHAEASKLRAWIARTKPKTNEELESLLSL
ncbi:hypothetical protein [Burkholderia cenocepacia]|uniref:hypothetical protein n=1 Tax=Burkholderia cenocepacia TaxID=95486 RepID=UPI000760C27E|nr:hypothetical protein [Burkholderia cenocepacia]KWU17751.1 hypothetical protein AS149_13605 [Burkholderia cenocepacia]